MSYHVSHITVNAGKKQLVRDVSLTLESGKITALLGPNGAGKTSLLKALIGLSDIESGNIVADGIHYENAPTDARIAHGMVYIPQHTSLFASMSVWDNLCIVKDFHPFWVELPEKEAAFEKEAIALLEQMNLLPHRQQTAGVLSGGQKRKLEVARALLMRPRLLLCDEPFAGVDPKSIDELMETFHSLAHTHQVAVLLSDHNVMQLLQHADYVYMMFDGGILAEGMSEEIKANQHVRSCYLGEQI